MKILMGVLLTVVLGLGVYIVIQKSKKEEGLQIVEGTYDPPSLSSTQDDPTVSRIFVTNSPNSAIVKIDGKEMGVTPCEIVIKRNREVTIELNSAGYFPFTKVFLAQKALEEVKFSLTKVPADSKE